MNHKPKISVITVVYNGEKYLEHTIQSVINQTYKNLEYIIIDGGSTDGTIDIIKKYKTKIDYWISEKDKGIYDAMNKGINVANSNSYLLFLNAGDSFYNNQTLKKIFQKYIDNNTGIIYGKTSTGKKILNYNKQITLKDMAQGMMICHQSTFLKKQI